MDKLNFFYANASLTGFSLYDFTIVLQRRGITNDAVPQVNVQMQAQTTILERLDVSFAPGHMKTLVAMVIESLAAYEAQHGTIPLPAAEQAQFEAAIGKVRLLKKN